MTRGRALARAEAEPQVELVERLRAVHLEMVEAVLAGEGLRRVAALAAQTAGAPVAIVVPRLEVAVAAPEGAAQARGLFGLERRRGSPPRPSRGGARGRDPGGARGLGGRAGGRGAAAGSGDRGGPRVWHLAAVASLTEAAIADAREEVEHDLRGSFLEELRAGRDLDARDVVRRAARLGCDLARGAVALCAELTTDRPRHVVATVAGDHPGGLAQHLDGRVYAVLPAAGGDEAPEATLAAARRLATRLGRHGTVGLSSFCADPAELPRALGEAELVLDVLRESGAPVSEDIGRGTYRLLFRVLASHPEEVRSFYEDTVAPLVRYDAQYGTDLVGTLEAYLENNCSMNATASAIYAHRHTVAYRLERVRELSGLDPSLAEGRERLGLGLKAYRVIAPRLPR